MMILQKTIAFASLISITLMAFTTSTSAESRTPVFYEKRTSLQKEEASLVAQNGNSCREVSAKGTGLYVRQEPTVYSTALGIVEDGRNVTIQGSSIDGWVRISTPIQGYVYADFLSSCQDSPPPQSCREVSAIGGLYVREEPTSNSDIVGVVANGRNVTIDNRGANGWVPISAPLQGYVFADYLSSCSSPY